MDERRQLWDRWEKLQQRWVALSQDSKSVIQNPMGLDEAVIRFEVMRQGRISGGFRRLLEDQIELQKDIIRYLWNQRKARGS